MISSLAQEKNEISLAYKRICNRLNYLRIPYMVKEDGTLTITVSKDKLEEVETLLNKEESYLEFEVKE